MESRIFIGIIIVCVTFIIIGAVRHNYELLINFLLRGVIGIASIIVLNMILSNIGTDISVGINSYTTLTSAFLGVPGVVVMYILSTYFYYTV